MNTGIELIAIERQRQMDVEGWTASHDGNHDSDELALAASCYALPSHRRNVTSDGEPFDWPFESSAWKPAPENRIKELVKAGALIAAEIDRLLNQ